MIQIQNFQNGKKWKALFLSWLHILAPAEGGFMDQMHNKNKIYIYLDVCLYCMQRVNSSAVYQIIDKKDFSDYRNQCFVFFKAN